MAPLPPLLQYVGLGIAVVVFLGSAAIFLRGNRDKGTIETLTLNNQALNGRVEILNTEVGRLRDQCLALEDANHVLINVANSSAAIAELEVKVVEMGGLIGDHHEASLASVEVIHGDIRHLPAAIAAAIGAAIAETGGVR